MSEKMLRKREHTRKDTVCILVRRGETQTESSFLEFGEHPILLAQLPFLQPHIKRCPFLGQGLKNLAHPPCHRLSQGPGMTVVQET